MERNIIKPSREPGSKNSSCDFIRKMMREGLSRKSFLVAEVSEAPKRLKQKPGSAPAERARRINK